MLHTFSFGGHTASINQNRNERYVTLRHCIEGVHAPATHTVHIGFGTTEDGKEATGDVDTYPEATIEEITKYSITIMFRKNTGEILKERWLKVRFDQSGNIEVI